MDTLTPPLVCTPNYNGLATSFCQSKSATGHYVCARDFPAHRGRDHCRRGACWCSVKKFTKRHLKNTMEKLNSAGIKLNKDKCQFCQQEMDFWGFVINKDGVKADPRKTKEILEMPDPTDVAELGHFLGMVTYLGRYLLNLS